MDHTDDVPLPDVTDEDLEEALRTTRRYSIVILKAGPNFEQPDNRTPDVATTVWAHGKRNFALRAAGVMPIICPVIDNTDLAGISIFDAAPAEVERIMSEDPGVQAGVFTYDVHATISFPGSALSA
jgi:hypothetical protein